MKGTEPPALRLLFCSLDYDATATGIPKYSGEIGAWLAGRGHRVEVVASHPHYPSWRVSPEYRARGFHREVLDGVPIWRVPVPLPERGSITPRGRMRMEAGFLAGSTSAWRRWSSAPAPDLVLAACPSFLAAVPALGFARAHGVPLVVQVQDLQADAASSLGMVRPSFPLRVARVVERAVLRSAAAVVTIGDRMAARVRALRGRDDGVVVVPNWADTGSIRPGPTDNPFRRELGVTAGRFLVMAAGSMGEKHGLEVVLEAAERFRHDDTVLFALVGDGSKRAALVEAARRRELRNVLFAPVQPPERLNDVLAAADAHLVVQRRDAADLVLPSKVGNILAAGRPMVVTTDPGTGLHDLVTRAGIGTAVPAEDAHRLAAELDRLRHDPDEREALGARARVYAEANLSKERVLAGLEALLRSAARRPHASEDLNLASDSG